jgi:UTP--glucose-1-phosphate uridylyltransferase
MQVDWNEIEAALQASAGPGFELDRKRVEAFAAGIAGGRLGADANRLSGELVPAGPADVDRLDALDSAAREQRRARGSEALARGEVAVAVLNGGMATRFGGVVKGVVEAFGGRSFLEIKHGQARAMGPGPFLVMNSFATHRATQAFLREHGLERDVTCFVQSVSVRLTPAGELFRGADGQPSFYAPGHGDFPHALRTSGVLDDLERRGVRFVMLSNVDNLGAEPDPVVIGHHALSGRALTCELAAVQPGDVGGSPTWVEGALRVVEGFRFPADFDFARLHYLSTNTFVMSIEALRQDFPLDYYYVEKKVDGRPAVQMERLVNELALFVRTGYLVTPRDGPNGRFFPVKAPADLEALRADPALVRRFAARPTPAGPSR